MFDEELAMVNKKRINGAVALGSSTLLLHVK